MAKFKVLRQHFGDKMYMPNDPDTGTREADPSTVAHLVAAKVLEPMGGSKKEPEPRNKAVRRAPRNKAK